MARENAHYLVLSLDCLHRNLHQFTIADLVDWAQRHQPEGGLGGGHVSPSVDDLLGQIKRKCRRHFVEDATTTSRFIELFERGILRGTIRHEQITALFSR